MKNYDGEWFKTEYRYHEEAVIHEPAELEMDFYEAIAGGDIEAVKKNNENRTFMQMQGRGVLSTNPVRNYRYHLVIAAALIARYCIHKGMSKEKAFTISDFYINAADKAETVEEILSVHEAMSLDYCRQMKEIVVLKVSSKPVVLALDYIYNHLHYPITISQVAEYAGVSRSHLSKIFTKEMGEPISRYITRVKMEKAQNMLRYSDFSITMISNNLGFSSESHFIQVFKSQFQTTPLKYREEHFRRDWSMIE